MIEKHENLDWIDVAIAGAGPAGLGSGLYTARGGLKTSIFGDPYQSQLAKAGLIENYLTYIEPVQGLELIEKMVAHVAHWGAQLCDEEIRRVAPVENGFALTLHTGSVVYTHALILAMGTKYKTLGIPGEEAFYAKGVTYCTLCDGPLYRGQPVAVIGDGNEAAAAALRLSAIASTVDLVIRPQPTADAILQARLDETENIRQFPNTEVREINGDASGVTAVRLQPRGQSPVTREVRAVFIEVGTVPSTAITAGLGLELDGPFIRVHGLQETNVPGVFAAGDITGSRVRQVAIAAGDGARAAIGAMDYVKASGLAPRAKGAARQWGVANSTPLPVEAPPAPDEVGITLADYVHHDAGFERRLEACQPDLALLQQIRERLPRLSVVIVSATWCADCRRNVPCLAQIATHLPDWDFRVFPRDDEARAKALGIRAVPTFILYHGDQEIGRIIERPAFGSLEADLWEIAKTYPRIS
jgi:thioredoxin reductase (NADPH)